MDIVQIVGYKNSGKTTLATRVIEELISKGNRVASLKHHGHGGVPLGMKDTDSEKHSRAGALIAGVEGEGVLQLSQQEPWNLEQMIPIYEMMSIDILVIEGFKNKGFNKIVLINKVEELPLLESVTNIKAVISSVSLINKSINYPVFKRHEVEKFCEWLVHIHLKK
ncbi:molybdopterin-guanine dinucleotide biosynthesis protein B [Oceanobacillus bengalensis]|uniref:Molybdopterin-guanine dinucleotide biosynthesis protein B n=1 Tax=Oceanobacillus bengalensis TaxID=1435466 RepID=A0A494Z4T1_9BACI|nr:molybdopterin-guanine dinucleotide biosynthesis protein B [Oceanobacillus bengalensis]RKQ17568.1 molybdopterin-guanine dinucleotide biosynthesis protein B [Oceanobacillus bengalensis]